MKHITLLILLVFSFSMVHAQTKPRIPTVYNYIDTLVRIYKKASFITTMKHLPETMDKWDTLACNQVVLRRRGLIYTLTIERAVDLDTTFITSK